MTDQELINREREPHPRAYEPLLSAVERAAYVAAHQIVSRVWGMQLAMTGEGEFCCPSVRRSRLVDEIAVQIIDAVEGGCLVMSKPQEKAQTQDRQQGVGRR